MKHFKETDLMVGDWVMWKNDHPIKIEEILVNDDGYAINGIWDYHELRSWINIDDIKPIPLTQSLLEANGFKVDGYAILNLQDGKWLEYYFHEHRFSMYYEGIDEWQNHSQVRDIIHRSQPFYVHEFQHSLRLCGLNDLADHFKIEE